MEDRTFFVVEKRNSGQKHWTRMSGQYSSSPAATEEKEIRQDKWPASKYRVARVYEQITVEDQK